MSDASDLLNTVLLREIRDLLVEVRDQLRKPPPTTTYIYPNVPMSTTSSPFITPMPYTTSFTGTQTTYFPTGDSTE